ncbi:MAG: DeoR/GlpR family DNA-binding transcription regulator [Verrucomicrobiota bacterium]
MTPLERRHFIQDRLEQAGACSYEELAAAVSVSTMTIRRDLEELVQQGRVIKTVGGVQRAHAPSYLYETALHSRVGVQREAKRAIARRALDLITGQPTIFLDGSTTCLELARLLARERRGLTIVTNSVLACVELGQGSAHTVTGIGGHYDADSLCYVGPQAEDGAKTLFVDLAFVSTKGFLPGKGTYESSLPNFRIKQLIARQCVELVLLVDHTKFGQRALSKVLDPAQIHAVVTDRAPRRADLAALEKAGCQVHIADTAVPAGRSPHAA